MLPQQTTNQLALNKSASQIELFMLCRNEFPNFSGLKWKAFSLLASGWVPSSNIHQPLKSLWMEATNTGVSPRLLWGVLQLTTWSIGWYFGTYMSFRSRSYLSSWSFNVSASYAFFSPPRDRECILCTSYDYRNRNLMHLEINKRLS